MHIISSVSLPIIGILLALYDILLFLVNDGLLGYPVDSLLFDDQFGILTILQNFYILYVYRRKSR